MQPRKKIVADTERDNFMTAQEAKEYGLIDDVVSRPPTAVPEDDDNNDKNSDDELRLIK